MGLTTYIRTYIHTYDKVGVAYLGRRYKLGGGGGGGEPEDYVVGGGKG